jgi:hypothetical protein
MDIVLTVAVVAVVAVAVLEWLIWRKLQRHDTQIMALATAVGITAAQIQRLADQAVKQANATTELAKEAVLKSQMQ